MFSIAKEVYVDQLPDFKVVGGDILDNLREELRDIATFRNQLRYRKPSEDETEDEGEVTYTDKPLHCLQLLPITIGIQLLPYVLNLLLGVVEVGRAGTTDVQVPRMLGESLLKSHSEP